MTTQTWIRVLGIILLAVAVSIVMLALVYALQNPHAPLPLASIGWNGRIRA